MSKQTRLQGVRITHVIVLLLLFGLLAGPLSFSAAARSAESLQHLSGAFAEAAKKVSPSVVHINTSKKVKVSSGESFFGIPPNHPLAPFFREFFDFPPQEPRQREEEPEEREAPIGMGSGLIVRSDGYILTNHHVVSDADVIKVIVEVDGHPKTYRVTEPPRVDADSDLAVLKIDASGLPAAEFGDSDKLEVGEWVIAIGNPFRLDQSVTAGIISYIGRPRGSRRIGSFIQTDAAINPGNSGGPLVNLDGEVVGINNAIAIGSPFERSYAGVGFAIPGNLAKKVAKELIEKGAVTRGFLGVHISPVMESFAKHTGLDRRDGALVNNVMDEGPAEDAGIKPKDVIIEYNGEPVEGPEDLQMKVADTEPGTNVRLKILRYEDDFWTTKTISVKIGTRPSGEEEGPQKGVPSPARKLGMTVQNLTESLAQRFGYEPGSGVIVVQVEPFSPADRAGIERYDLIREVNNEKVTNVSEFEDAVAKRSDSALIVYEREGRTSITVIELE